MQRKAEISKLVGSGWLLEITSNGIIIKDSQHPSYAYARDSAKLMGLDVPILPPLGLRA